MTQFKKKIIISGASSGLGLALANKMAGQGHIVHGFALDSRGLQPTNWSFVPGVDVTGKLDYLAERIGGYADVVINCAGINVLAEWGSMTAEEYRKVMDTNVLGIINTTQAFLDGLIKASGTVVNIVSNASHMPMTHSAIYNASKGAAHILTLQMARELTKQGVTVFGVSPAKLEGTTMSNYIDNTVPAMRGWTRQEAREYQLRGLLTGKEIPPETLAEFLAWLLADKSRHEFFAGCVIPYGA